MPITDQMALGELNNYLPPAMQAINKDIAETYGKDLLGRPKFRISHSKLAIERRIGTIEETYGQIIVREFFGSREVPKYNYFNGYVLEQLEHQDNPELLLSQKGHYEPKWTDWGPDGLPNLAAVKLVIRSILFGVKHTKSDWQAMEAKEEQAGYERARAEIENASTVGSGEMVGYRKA